MVRMLFSTVVAAIIGLTTIAFVNAQTGPVTAPPTNPPATQPPATTPPQAGMNDAEILAFLKTLDPNVQSAKLENGTEYRLTVKADGWAYTLRLEVYGTNIWLDSELGAPISDITKVPSTVLAELLRANLKVGPTHFALMKVNNNLQLNACRQVLRPITADGLRAQIDQFCKDIKDTYPQWNAVSMPK
jgi:hypothetical protein